eukprot:2287938-Pleurochrysis_carterae.AAC.1
MAIGSVSAVLWRKQASDDWQQCIIERVTEQEFQVWDKSGGDSLESYAHGRDEDGSPLNDSVEEEFGLTLDAPALQSTDLTNGDNVVGEPVDPAQSPANLLSKLCFRRAFASAVE